jgi:hypothetical protein
LLGLFNIFNKYYGGSLTCSSHKYYSNQKHSEDKRSSLFCRVGRYEEENVLTTLSPVRVRAKPSFLSQTSDQVSIL